MKKRLAVILGAGASYGSVSDSAQFGVNWDWRPPLTSELFDDRQPNGPVERQRRQHFQSLLSQYPRADGLKGDMLERMRGGSPLESVLREFRDGPDYIVRQFQQVPLYLQTLLGEVSRQFVPNAPHNLASLVRRLLAPDFEKVAFITLNYDLLFEQALDTAGDYPIKQRATLGLDWYVSTSERWLFTKLHGSVNWGTGIQVDGNFVQNDRSAALELLEDVFVRDRALGPIEILPNHKTYSVGNDLFYYPALAVPVDDKYVPVCPPDHLEALAEFLTDCRNLLVIGTAAKDQDLLELLGGHMKSCERVAVVAGPQEDAHDALSRLSQTLDFDLDHSLSLGGGFSKFMQGPLESFIETLN